MQNRSFEKYGKVYTSNISYLYSPILSKEADKTPIISKMYVDRRPETYDCFQAGFFTWFNQQNVVYNPFERIKKFFRIMPAEYDSYDMVDCFLFAKYMSIIGKGIFSLSENDVNTLHYVDSIRDSDMTLYLQDGQILAEGTHDELLKSCAQYRELYEKEDKQ
ncbi:ABC transporter ATP-binding protein/permease [Butyrivibrio sp. YAB3001]|uniref:ABC transporter ATP-binding protein/permease n=1 Tax=Butyrivibrio sp. YAB3001 TaxID=1520812 RepID=UPI0008F677C4|nr:ABC transporter ATP-binding protein/permease [Butyrivibrio sp. YAB3001]SFC46942.1 hypothetical protein SAMN02910398_02310 [Butyrivibrio sp. YAB3001]